MGCLAQSNKEATLFEVDCSQRPLLTDVAQTLSICLDADATVEAVKDLLSLWQYNRSDVLMANLRPKSEKAELVITYEDGPYAYDPQGKIAVLEYSRNKWMVIFESPDPTEPFPLSGDHTLEGNWSFKLDQVVDMQADGAEEILFTQEWSNITRLTINISKLLIMDFRKIKPILIEGDSFHTPSYSVDGPNLLSSKNYGGVNIVRTLSLENGQIVEEKVEEFANHNLAKLSVELPDGTIYFSFDDDACSSSNSHTLKSGLYRLKDGDVFHYGDGGYICHIEILSDGNLYASGAGVWKVEANSLIPIQNQYAPLLIEDDYAYGLTAITDIAMNSKGELWAKNLHGLFFYGHQQSEWFLMGHGEIENRFRENLLLDPDNNRGPLVIGPDDSLWVLGWDGYAERRCCIFRFQNSELTVFQRDDELPVSAELREQIFADE